MEGIKVFRMNDCDWMAAASLDEAVKSYRTFTGHECEDAGCCDNPREVTDAEMGKLLFSDEDGTRRTFREQLDREVSAGSKFPAFFASTEC